jgi:hypothetical protein
VRASEHTPVEVAVADADIERDTEGALETLMVVLTVRDSVRLALTVRESVGSIDPLAVTLLDTEVDAVSEAVKLGDTGDFVRDGVGVGEGMIAVYDMKNTDPEPRLIILAPIWDPPAFQKVASEIPVCSVVPTAVPEKSM